MTQEELPDEIARYLDAPLAGRNETLAAEECLGRLLGNQDEDTKALIWALLEMIKRMQADFTAKELLLSELRDQLKAAKTTNIHNNLNQVAQAGEGNSAAAAAGERNMSNNINVGGSAIINIDSYLQNVTNTIGASDSLNSNEKTQLEALVKALGTALKPVEQSHKGETEAILEAAQRAVNVASKPAAERKKSILDLTASGLKAAAETVKDIAPLVLTTALEVCRFIQGLAD